MKIHFKLCNQLSELNILYENLQVLGKKWLLTKKFLAEINLVLDELITNIIEHGEPGKRCSISVLIEKKKESITIEVTDDGPPFDPTRCKKPDVTLPLEQRKCGGLGVLFVHKFSDSCSYKRIKNLNVFTVLKNLPQEGR